MSNIEDITLSDFDADTPSGKNWDEHVSCGEIPLVVYEALEDYEENSQVTLYNDTENSTELYKYLMEYVRKMDGQKKIFSVVKYVCILLP